MRLRDFESNDPVLREAGRLLRAVEPGQPSPWRRPERAHAPRRRALFFAPRFAFAIVLLCVGAFAFASAWHARSERIEAAARQTLTIPTVRGEAQRARVVAAVIETPVVETPVVVPMPEALAAVPARDTVPIAEPVVEHVRVHHVERADAVLPTPAVEAPVLEVPVVKAPVVEQPLVPASDASLLQQATRALKHDHDAPLAAKLADDHLARFPSSDLREEAFALSMSAHDALADGIAPSVAHRYLARFPAGRFAADARHLDAR